MKIAQINLPKADNNGNAITTAHDYVAQTLCLAFGGLTQWDAIGSWIDNGALYREAVTVYQVAFGDDPDLRGAELLRSIATNAGNLGGQIAMFLVIDGEAEIIDI